MNRTLLATALTVSLSACGGTPVLDVPQPADELQLQAAGDTLPTALSAHDLWTLRNLATSRCIEPADWKADSGATIKPGTCSDRASFGYTVTRLPSGNYTFRNYFSGKCLEVTEGDLRDGAKVTQRECTGAPSQQWRAIEITTNTFELRAAHSDKCLDLDSWGNVQQWSCWGGSNQRWTVQLAQRSSIQVVNGPTDSRRKCLDADGSSFADGGSIMQWDCWGGPNQQWYVLRFQDDSVEIKARHSGKCLDIAGAALENGTLAQQWTCDGQPSRRFNLVPQPGRVSQVVRPRHSLKCLDRPGVANSTNGALIQQWACNDGVNQSWIFSGL
jgi:hypothetical protein